MVTGVVGQAGGRRGADASAAGHEVVAGLGVLGLVDPGRLVVVGDAPSDRGPEAETDDRGEDGGEDERGQGDDDLHDELVDAVTVEQPALGGEEPGAEGAPEAGDEVDADDVERVVVAEPELQADGEGREAAGDGAVKELLGAPDAGDMLEEGLDALGLSPELPQA